MSKDEDSIEIPLGFLPLDIDYKFELYGVMNRCFILLSHFVIVKDLGLL